MHAQDTLSGIAAEHGVSLASVEADNPQFSDPNLIYVGQSVNLPGGGTGTVTARLPQAPAPAPVYQSPASPSSIPARTPVSVNVSQGGSLDDIPGVPSSFVKCVAFRESTNDTNPAANGNAYGIIPASGHDVEGASLATQKAAFAQLYSQDGGTPWAADGCPGT